MAIWERDSDLSQALDYRLVRDTFVTMFWKRSILDDTVRWLVERDYDVVTLDAGSWNSARDMFRDVAEALDFPDYFGQNLDALNDCLRDVATGDYGWRKDAAGLVLVLTGFETFAALDRRTAQVMLDIFADRARGASLVGTRLICLIQSNDPRLSFEPVGAMPVMWNDAEWLDRKSRPLTTARETSAAPETIFRLRHRKAHQKPRSPVPRSNQARPGQTASR